MKKLLALLALTIASVGFAADSKTINIGDGFTIVVKSDGTAPFAYQWYKNNFPIPTTLATPTNLGTYAINSASATDAGKYTVSVTNSMGSAMSDIAEIIVTPAAAIKPANATTTITVRPKS